MRGSRVETYKPHKISNAFGRRRVSRSQHRWINAHKPSVKVGWVGRGGRSPPVIASITTRGGLSLNGTAPVKAFIQMNGSSPDVSQVGDLQRTSIMTIANEKTSDSLLCVPPPSKISGAIHRALSPCSAEVFRIESRS